MGSTRRELGLGGRREPGREGTVGSASLSGAGTVARGQLEPGPPGRGGGAARPARRDEVAECS